MPPTKNIPASKTKRSGRIKQRVITRLVELHEQTEAAIERRNRVHVYRMGPRAERERKRKMDRQMAAFNKKVAPFVDSKAFIPTGIILWAVAIGMIVWVFLLVGGRI